MHCKMIINNQVLNKIKIVINNQVVKKIKIIIIIHAVVWLWLPYCGWFFYGNEKLFREAFCEQEMFF